MTYRAGGAVDLLQPCPADTLQLQPQSEAVYRHLGTEHSSCFKSTNYYLYMVREFLASALASIGIWTLHNAKQTKLLMVLNSIHDA